MERKRWKRLLLVVVTAALGFISIGTWAIASPVGAAPDDDFHMASIWCSLGERQGLCGLGEAENERIVSERFSMSPYCFAGMPEESAACEVDDEAMVPTTRGNFAGNYPPVFYAVMGVFAGPDIAVSTIVMRVFNAGILVGAITAVLALLRRGEGGPLIWSAVVTMVPLGMFIVPSVNPSSWAVISGLVVWIATYGFFSAEGRGRRIALAAIAIVLAVMGAGARGDSAVYVGFAALAAMILSFQKSRAWLKLALLPSGLIAIGIAFFLSARQSTGAAGVGIALDSSVASDPTAASPLSDLLVNLIYLPWLWTGGTGTWGLGWIDTPVPPTVWVAMLGVLVGLVFWGLRIMSRRKGTVLVLALLGLTLIPLYVLYGLEARVGSEIQPRYLLPLLIVFVGVAAFGFAHDHLGLSRLQAGVLLAAVAIANALSLHNNMRRYISGIGDSSFNLNANIEWWWEIPVQPMTVWFVGSAAFLLMMVGLFIHLYPTGERPRAPLDERAPVPGVAPGVASPAERPAAPAERPAAPAERPAALANP